MKQLTVEASIQKLPEVLSFIDTELEEAGTDMKTQLHIDLAVEEIYVNIANYAYAPKSGEATIQMDISGDPPVIEIKFKDSGKPYNPLENEDPDITLSVEEREIGGLGVFIAKKNMDELSYCFENSQNVLTIRKNLILH